MTTQTEVLPSGTWTADPVHSTIGFAVDYMAGTFQGTFSQFEAGVSDGKLTGSGDVASIQVKDPNLEAHLQAPDFFDAERHPKLSFESREVSRSGNELQINGDITIKAAGKVAISADGDIALQASGNLELTAQQNVTMKGLAVTVEGQSQAKLKAAAISIAGLTQLSAA